MAKSRLYTATGDKGTTSLIGGARVAKHSQRLEAYGTLDELNSHTGLLRAMIEATAAAPLLDPILGTVQNTLFDIGTSLATPPAAASSAEPISTAQIKDIETAIDAIDDVLPPLRSFILPAGTQAAAQAHVARTVCRRAERRVLALAETEEVDQSVMRYLNRLSDYLFIAARYLNFIAGVDEITWKK